MIDLSKPNVFTPHIKTLRETSYDKDNDQYMTNSTFPAVDFDGVKNSYVFSKSSISAREMRSNDALVIYNTKQGQFIFIEFKNGNITSKLEKEKIRVKITESLLILNDILGENLTFDRENVNYILVYNESKNSEFEKQRKTYRSKIAAAFASMAKMEYLINGFSRYNAFFHNVNTINETEFQSIATKLGNSTYKF